MGEMNRTSNDRRLLAFLRAVRERAGPTFTGIGVLVSEAPELLPLVPLRATSKPPLDGAPEDVLAAISRSESEYHDGFHVLSSDFRLLLVSQFFSPPPQLDLPIDRRMPVGGRY